MMIRVLVLVGAMVAPAAIAECDYSDFPKMVEMRVSTLMSDARYNNRPMSVRSFSAGVAVEELVRFYQREWRDEFAESEFEAWKQISHLEDNCLYTVQYGSVGGNTFGRLLMSPVPEGNPDAPLGVGVVKPGDAMVVSDLLTDDGPKKGRVTVITSEQSVSELVGYYRAEMSSDGWSLEHSFQRNGGSVLVFRNRLSETNVVIMPAGSATQILVNEVEVE